MTVYINGTTGYSGPVGVLGDLTTTGNTILGDQSTDTLNVANGNLVLNSSGNLGIGTASPAERLHIFKSTYPIFKIESTSYNSTMGIDTGNGNLVITNASNAGLVFSTNNTERMRLDSSGNLGVGTSTPGGRISASGGYIRCDLGSAGTSLILNGTGSNFQVDHSVSGYATLLNSGGGLAFSANGSERARIDTSGNFSVGNTAAAYVQLQPAGNVRGVHANGAGGDTVIGAITGVSNGYQISVTTGNAQTYKWFNGGTQSMTLDASGNLGIGIATPVTKLHLLDSGPVYIQLTDSGDGASRVGQNGAALTFGVDNANGATERMRISSTQINTYQPLSLDGGMAATKTTQLSGTYTGGTWYEIGNNGNIGTGVFILTAYVDTYACGGSVYFMEYASIPFYFWNVSSNASSTYILPVMYGVGHADNGVNPPRIRLRMTSSGAGVFVDMDPIATWTGVDGTSGKTVIFRFKRIA